MTGNRGSLTVECVDPTKLDSTLVADVHDLLKVAIGGRDVEPLESFKHSLVRTDKLVPLLLVAKKSNVLVGAMFGNYLTKLNAGMVIYAGVRSANRGNGFYGEMRHKLIKEFHAQSHAHAKKGVDFVISELADTSLLMEKYLHEWGAFVVDCEYLQPAVQGLQENVLNLVIQPVSIGRFEIELNMENILSEIYREVYRVDRLDRDDQFQSMIQSLTLSEVSG